MSTVDFVTAFGLNGISLVRASGGTFRRRVFDALEGMRDPCPLGEQFCWHPVLPDPALPSAGSPDPNRPWYVRVLDSASRFNLDFFFLCSRRDFQTSCLQFLGWRSREVVPFPSLSTLPPSHPALARSPAQPCPTMRRPTHGISGFWNRFPDMPWHDKGLHRQKSAGPLVSSQEQRALLVPRLNRT